MNEDEETTGNPYTSRKFPPNGLSHKKQGNSTEIIPVDVCISLHFIGSSSTTLLEKYPSLSFFFFFCENLVYFNEAHLHEATLNLHMHA